MTICKNFKRYNGVIFNSREINELPYFICGDLKKINKTIYVLKQNSNIGSSLFTIYIHFSVSETHLTIKKSIWNLNRFEWRMSVKHSLTKHLYNTTREQLPPFPKIGQGLILIFCPKTFIQVYFQCIFITFMRNTTFNHLQQFTFIYAPKFTFIHIQVVHYFHLRSYLLWYFVCKQYSSLIVKMLWGLKVLKKFRLLNFFNFNKIVSK